jgi:hypothetical protein
VGQIEDLNNGGFLVHRNRQGVKMNKKSGTSKDAADKLVKNIRRKTRNRRGRRDDQDRAGWPEGREQHC